MGWIDVIGLTPIDADTIRYEVTVGDPTTWTRPWTPGRRRGKMTAEARNAVSEWMEKFWATRRTAKKG